MKQMPKLNLAKIWLVIMAFRKLRRRKILHGSNWHALERVRSITQMATGTRNSFGHFSSVLEPARALFP